MHSADDARIFHKECVSLARAGHDVTLIVPNTPTTATGGVRVEGVDVAFRGRLQRIRRVARALYARVLDLKPDVVHFHDPEFLPYAVKLVRQGFRVIYDAHEDFPRQLAGKHYIPGTLAGLVGRVAERYENHCASRFTHIIAATDHIRDRFLKVNPGVTTVRNFPILHDMPQGQMPIGDRAPRAIYIGSITEKRGAFTMVEAMRYVDGKLILAGQIDSEATLSRLKAYPWFDDKVDFLGPFDYRQVAQLLLKARVGLVLLHPIESYRVALPVKLFDYMTNAVPVVVSGFPLWKQIIEESRCGVCVDPLNTAQIADAINGLFIDTAEAGRMGLRGRQAIEERYNWNNESKVLLDVYHKVLSN